LLRPCGRRLSRDRRAALRRWAAAAATPAAPYDSRRRLRRRAGRGRRACRLLFASPTALSSLPPQPANRLPESQALALYPHGDAEAVVAVLKLRRDAAAGGDAGDLDLVSPRAAARRLALSRRRPLRVTFGRAGVVLLVVPIGAPFVYVLGDVVEAEP